MSDPLYGLVALALDFEAAPAGFGSKLILDRSTATHPCVCAQGAAVATAWAHSGTQSMRNPGTGYLSCGSGLDYAIDAGVAFCVESWVDIDAAQVNPYAAWFFMGGSSSGGWSPGSISTSFNRPDYPNKISIFVFNADSRTPLIAGGPNLCGAGATHVAVSRDVAGSWNLWVNGTSVATATYAGPVALPSDGNVSVFMMGDPSSSNVWCTGSLDDARITIGDPRYTEAFTPPATLDLPTVTITPTVTSKPLYGVGRDTWRGPTNTRMTQSLPASAIDAGGKWAISGVVDIDGSPPSPAARRVRLFEEDSGRLHKVTWSNAATGAYSFGGLVYQPYFVLVDDDLEGNYNSVIKARVVPVAR